DRRLFGDGQRVGDELSERRERDPCHEESGASAEDGENDALGDELPNDALATRTERGPHADLALAADRSREEETSEVRAGEEEYAERCPAEGEQQHARLVRELVSHVQDIHPGVL